MYPIAQSHLAKGPNDRLCLTKTSARHVARAFTNQAARRLKPLEFRDPLVVGLRWGRHISWQADQAGDQRAGLGRLRTDSACRLARTSAVQRGLLVIGKEMLRKVTSRSLVQNHSLKSANAGRERSLRRPTKDRARRCCHRIARGSPRICPSGSATDWPTACPSDTQGDDCP
jgi:hypothetical protein